MVTYEGYSVVAVMMPELNNTLIIQHDQHRCLHRTLLGNILVLLHFEHFRNRDVHDFKAHKKMIHFYQLTASVVLNCNNGME